MWETFTQYLPYVVALELVIIIGLGWWYWNCCKKVNDLKAIIDHYRKFVASVVKCVDKACPGQGNTDPDWPPPKVPEWP